MIKIGIPRALLYYQYHPMWKIFFEVMGAIRAALLVHEEMTVSNNGSKFKGFGVSEIEYHTSSFECEACPNLCEKAQLSIDGQALARWGGAVTYEREVRPAKIIN
ncbi:hypothetical protein ACFLU8_00630 [Chloroflexota bacterium]